MANQALIVWGGWEGHQPKEVAEHFKTQLQNEGFQVEVSNDMDALLKLERFENLKLIIPVITMSTITSEQCASVRKAVAERGVGLAGCHGGMCDAFRTDTEWQFMTGGQWVAHPGDNGVRYMINMVRSNPHPITAGLPDFEVHSEQYYMHTDPGNNVLATTDFPHPGVDGPHTANKCKMPQVWTKMYGKGRVFYFAVGHQRSTLEPEGPREVMRRGMLWAAGLLG